MPNMQNGFMGAPMFGQMGFNPQAASIYAPKYEVIRINGEAGADALQMAPNSEVLLLDNTAPLVWLVQTDGAGSKVKLAFDITAHVPETPVDTKALLSRIEKLEEIIHGKSDTGGNAE